MKVYFLVDELCGDEIRFVGVCEDVKSVLTTHKSLIENGKLNEWVTKCIRAGFPPKVQVIEETENGEESARVWVGILRKRGHRLFNPR